MVILLGESQLQKKEEFKARKFLVLITILPRIRAVLPLIPSHRIIAEQPRSQSSSAISDVTSPVKLVTCQAITLGSKPPLVTRIARKGLGTRLIAELYSLLHGGRKLTPTYGGL